MAQSIRPIGVFDSGIGGLTVARHLKTLLPNEQLIYFGDTARVPYGNKSATTVVRYCDEIIEFLIKQKVKCIVVACNTASALAVEELEKTCPIPMIGTIHSGAEYAVKKKIGQKIAILGTRGTILSGAYQQAIRKMHPSAELYPIFCPLFVPLIEEGWLQHSVTRDVMKEYLAPLMGTHIDTLILGCTHYPLLGDIVKEVMGPLTEIVDPGFACALRVQKILEEHALISPMRMKEDDYYVSDDPERFKQMAETVIGFKQIRVKIAHLEPSYRERS